MTHTTPHYCPKYKIWFFGVEDLFRFLRSCQMVDGQVFDVCFHFYEQRLNSRDILWGCYQKKILQKPDLFHKYHRQVTLHWCRAITLSHLSLLCHECDLMVECRCVADWPKDPLFEAEKPFADEAPGSAGRVGVFYVGWGATTDVQRCNSLQKTRPEANKDEFLHNLALSHGQFSSIQWPIWPVNWVSKLTDSSVVQLVHTEPR